VRSTKLVTTNYQQNHKQKPDNRTWWSA